MKALAVLLYGMGGMSFSMIGRVVGVSDVAVLKWVRAEGWTGRGDGGGGRDVALPEKNLPSFGSGAPMTWISGEPWPGCWVGVMMRPASD